MHYLCTHLRYLGRVVRHQSAKLGTAVRFCKVPQQKKTSILGVFFHCMNSYNKKKRRKSPLYHFITSLYFSITTRSVQTLSPDMILTK